MIDRDLEPIRAALASLPDDRPRLDLWWRDDDAVAATPALERLLHVASGIGAPLALAAVPALLQPSLPQRLRDEAGVTVLVHGFAHRDHAGAGGPKAEFGPHRALPPMQQEAEDGRARVFAAFPGSARPVFVPPWNRIAPDLVPRLAPAGFLGLSTFGRSNLPAPGERSAAGTSPGGDLPVVNTHLDPVDWRGGRGATPIARLARALREAIATEGPIGLLTHHLAFDEATWTLTTALVETFARHPAVTWRAVDDLWPAARPLNPDRIGDLTYRSDTQ